MSTVYYILQQTMFFAVPLLIVALGAMFSEHSGVSNIALEGIMIVGAFTGTLTIERLSGVISGQLLYLLAIAVAGISGLIYSLFHAWSSIRLRADQTISGTALNMFAPAFCIFIARNAFGVKQISFHDASFIHKVPLLGDIPFIGPAFFQNCYISTYIGILLLIVLNYLLNRTRFGLRLSACGENPDSAASAGIRVTRIRYYGVLISGLLGGMGGVIFVVPTSTNFSASVAGYGFLALAVLILGQWKPSGILLSAFFFGLMKALSSSYSGIPFLKSLPIPSEVYKIVPYLVTLVVLALSSRNSRAPKAVGQPYDDGAGFGFSGGTRGKVILAVICAAAVGLTAFSACTAGNRTIKNGVSAGYGADIALVLSSESSVDDKSFVQGEWEGLLQYGAESGRTVKYYRANDNSDESMKNAIDMAVKGHAKTVVIATNTLEYALYDTQYKYPEISFIAMDCTPVSRDSDEKIAPNTVCLFIDEAECGFLAGYATVADGYRNLGFIGGMALPSVIRFGYGFLYGAECAARELGLEPGAIRVMYHYAGTFNATPEVLSLASAWYQSGTEAIFACGGSMGNSVMKAAENVGTVVIGVDADQSVESPSVITSAMKNIADGMYTMLNSVSNGEISGGQSVRIGAAENAIRLPMETSRFRSFDQAQYDEIYRKLTEDAYELPDENTASDAEGLPLELVEVTLVR